MSRLEVLISDLRLRKTPSLKGSILGYAKKGIHTYIDTKTADGFKWYHIDDGYVAEVKDAIKVLGDVGPVPRDTTKDQIYVGDFVLNMRSKPTTSASKVGSCEKNSYYNVLDKSNEVDYTWYKLGDECWVAGVDGVIFYKAGGSDEAEKLKKELEKAISNFEIVSDCIAEDKCSDYYKELRLKLEDVNKYINDNFDQFEYDLVDDKEYKEIDLLYTADVHGAWVGYDINGNYLTPIFNYDDINNYRTKLNNNNIKALLVDAGDWSRPCRAYNDFINTGVSQPANQMNSKNYFVSTCGNHEWRWPLNDDISIENVLNKSKSLTACNIFKNGKLLYKPYKTAKIGSKKLAIIGIGYPSANGRETYSDGVWTYGSYTILDDQKLYNVVQSYIDEFKKNKFDYIVVVSHMCKSTYESDSRYRARTDYLIKNTKGLTAVIQGHYNYATQAETILDRSGKSVLLAHESGANMNSFGRLQLRPGKVTSYLLDERSDLNII